MKPRSKFTIVICVALAILLAVFTVGYTFAWFANYSTIEISLYTDDEGGYFESGSGTEDDPYVISNYKHLYNLAWLQNMGKFSGSVYFELSADIDMLVNNTAYCVIPPIGNDSNPFNGVFNGNGHTISNLVVSTDKSKLSNTDAAAADGYEFSNYVGLFGNTGAGSDIYNFILDNPIVEVANENTAYSSGSSAYCGLAIGYVAGKASSIGVIGGYLCVNKGGYSTYNSILGDIDPDVSTSVTGGTSGELGSGGDLGYGSTINLKTLYETLTSNTETTDDDNGTPVGAITGSYALPIKAESQEFIETTESSVTVDNIDGSKISTMITQKGSTNNIGYYVGSDVKVYNALGTGQTVEEFYEEYYSKFYYPSTQDSVYECDGTTYPQPDSTVTDYLKKYGNYLVRLSSTSQLQYNKDYIRVVENGQVGSYSGKVVLPNKCIWVAPVEAGTFKFVVVNTTNKAMSFRVSKITRSTKKDYSSAFSVDNNYMYYNGQLAPGYAFYFEIEIEEDDVGVYEYAITAGDKGDGITYQPYIAYIDIGTSGGGTSVDDSTGEYDSDYDVSAIDFIYKNVTISQTSFSFVVNTDDYIATGTRITFTAATGDSAAIVMGFYRNDSGYYSPSDTSDTAYNITVTYYISVYGVPTQSKSTAYIVLDSSLSSLAIPPDI